MTDSFVQRNIRVTLSVGIGQYGDDGREVHTLEGHRVSLTANQYGDLAQGELNCRIYGMSLELMNRMTSIGPVMNQIRWNNTIQVEAGNEGEELATVFIGAIDTAYADLNGAPDVPLVIRALSAGIEAIAPASPTSYNGSVQVDQILRDLAGRMNLAYEGNEINGTLENPYLPGTLLDQLKSVVLAANINYSVDNGILYAWPMNGNIKQTAHETSPQMGMVGYPTFSAQGMIIEHLFLPYARIGGRIKISDSEITSANGTWGIYQVTHELDSIVPEGRWFTTMAVQAKYDD